MRYWNWKTSSKNHKTNLQNDYFQFWETVPSTWKKKTFRRRQRRRDESLEFLWKMLYIYSQRTPSGHFIIPDDILDIWQFRPVILCLYKTRNSSKLKCPTHLWISLQFHYENSNWVKSRHKYFECNSHFNCFSARHLCHIRLLVVSLPESCDFLCVAAVVQISIIKDMAATALDFQFSHLLIIIMSKKNIERFISCASSEKKNLKRAVKNLQIICHTLFD